MSLQNAKVLRWLNPRMTLADRIKEAIGGKSQADIARATKKTEGAVSQWLDGTTKSLKAETAVMLEAATGFRAAWLATGKGPKMATQNTAPGPEIRGTVPLLSSVQAGNYKEYVDNYHAGDGGMEGVATTAPIKAHTFALRVAGDSMSPRFVEGMILIVEPELDPQPGDFVISKNGSEETTFKQLMRDGSEWYLKPLNPQYPTKPLGDAQIIGVVRAVEWRLR